MGLASQWSDQRKGEGEVPVHGWGVPEFIAKHERRFLVGRTVGDYGALNGVSKAKCQLVDK